MRTAVVVLSSFLVIISYFSSRHSHFILQREMFTFALRIVNQLFLGNLKKIPVTNPYQVPFRCWPIDLDLFFHMNNASYFRVAELARWRMFPQTNMVSIANSLGAMFLVVDQNIKYIRPIGPFQKYVVNTKLTVSDDKWIHNIHTFQQHPDHVKNGEEPKIYAVVDCKAVIKVCARACV